MSANNGSVVGTSTEHWLGNTALKTKDFIHKGYQAYFQIPSFVIAKNIENVLFLAQRHPRTQ